MWERNEVKYSQLSERLQSKAEFNAGQTQPMIRGITKRDGLELGTARDSFVTTRPLC